MENNIPKPDFHDIRRFQTGDLDAFERSVQGEAGRMLGYINRYVHSNDLAEDIFQEVWIRIWKSRELLKNAEYLRSWIYQICRAAIYDETRRKAWNIEMTLFNEGELTQEYPDKKSNPRDSAQNQEWRLILNQQIQKLDQQSQDIIALRFDSGLKLREIAEVLNMPLGSVSTKLRNSLILLKQELRNIGIKKNELACR